MSDDFYSKDIFEGKKKINKEIRNIQVLNQDFGIRVKKHLESLKDAWVKQSLKEIALKDREKNYESIFNYAGVGIAQVSPKTGQIMKANKRFFEIVGWSADEMRSKTSYDITHPDDLKKNEEYLRALNEGESKRTFIEKRYVRKDGTIRWARVTGSSFLDEEKAFGISIVEDIHAQKETEEKLRSLAEAGKILAKSLNVEKILEEVSRFIVPKFADLLEVDFLEDNGEYRRVKSVYPGNHELAERLHKYAPKYHGEECYTTRAVRAGQSFLLNTKTDRRSCPYGSPNFKKALKNLKEKSFMLVPLQSRNGPLGVIILRSAHKYSRMDVSFVEQIASLAAMAIENARLYEKEQKAVEARDSFLSIASHELKTYLTSIKALSQLLERQCSAGADGKKKNHKMSLDYFQKLDTTINRCTRLINNLLDVGRIESGRLSLIKEEFSLFPLINETVENFQRTTKTHRIILSGKTQKKINGDKDYISEVLTNLLANAVKYSPKSKEVTLDVRDEGENIIVKVQDNGIGIAKGIQKKIFDRFFRSDITEKRGISGMGLGLYIASVIVKMHNAKIWVNSRVNKGSKFYISFPALEESSSTSN